MKYRNIKTGIIIDVPSELSGANWKKISTKAPAKEPSVDVPAVSEEIKTKKTRKSK